MSFEVTKFPKSEAFEIQQVTNSGGFAAFDILADYDNINLREGGNLYIVGNSDYNGTHVITSYSQASPSTLQLTTSTSYSTANTDGQILSQSYSDAESNWNASRSTPLNVEIQRRDLEIQFITGTFVASEFKTVVRLVSAIPSEIIVGSSVYVNSGTAYDGIYTVADLISSEVFRCEETFLGTSSGGFVNSNDYKKNYYIELAVTVDTEQTTLELFPDLAGQIKSELNEIVYSYLIPENDFDYSAISAKDENLGKYFTFSITENWLTSSESTTTFTEKFYFCYARRNIGDVGNMYEYVVREAGDIPYAKWLTQGENRMYLTTDGYMAFPFALDTLTIPSVVQKNEVSLDKSNNTLSDDSYNLNDAQNSLNRIRLEKYYSDNVKAIDVSLIISKTVVTHFWDAVPLSGQLVDENGNQDGKLSLGSCLKSEPGAEYDEVQITLPDFITIASGTESNDGTATILKNGVNILRASVQGKFWNLQFEDTDGNSYHFPCIEYYTDERRLALIHGYKLDASSNKTIIYASVQECQYDTQETLFWHTKGMTKIEDGGSETIHVPYDADSVRLHTLGVDDENYYQIDLLPIS